MGIWNLFFSTLLLPLVGIALLWRRPRVPAGAWVATFAMALGLTAFSVLASPWGWFGLPLRYMLVVLFVLAVGLSLRRRPPEEQRPESPLRLIVKVLIAFFFGGVAIGVMRAGSVPPGAIDLRFPLRGGTFIVGHGGSDSAANIHAQNKAQRFAVDLMALNNSWRRARGLHPKDLQRYAIWNAGIVSPCSGQVVAAVDGLPDNPIGTMDEKNMAGNHVVLRCGTADVTLAHLRQGSIVVKKGESVAAGAPLGAVGNSGNSSEPHLHIHAERNGEAVPARFDGEWLVRNDVVEK